ncbi:hypothetical protein UlMin_015653 [Ulmus minor]
MLQDVADLDLSDYHGNVGIPRQLVVTKDPLSIPYEVTNVISFFLFLFALDQFSLPELKPPLVLQEFFNHGGILFKIYIVGKSIKVVRQFVLPDVSKCELEEVAGVFYFPRVSDAAATTDEADLDPSIAELPPSPLIENLHGTSDVFYVIDINYFPGYGKMPEYEQIFTYFLLSLMQNKYKKRADA